MRVHGSIIEVQFCFVKNELRGIQSYLETLQSIYDTNPLLLNLDKFAYNHPVSTKFRYQVIRARARLLHFSNPTVSVNL